jgi:hypothetical protein
MKEKQVDQAAEEIGELFDEIREDVDDEHDALADADD